MCERLWEIPQGLAARPESFPVETQMIRMSSHSFKEQSSFNELRSINPTSSSQCFDQPKRAHVERPLFVVKTVGSHRAIVPVDEAIRYQPTFLWRAVDHVQNIKHSGVVGAQKNTRGIMRAEAFSASLA